MEFVQEDKESSPFVIWMCVKLSKLLGIFVYHCGKGRMMTHN